MKVTIGPFNLQLNLNKNGAKKKPGKFKDKLTTRKEKRKMKRLAKKHKGKPTDSLTKVLPISIRKISESPNQVSPMKENDGNPSPKKKKKNKRNRNNINTSLLTAVEKNQHEAEMENQKITKMEQEITRERRKKMYKENREEDKVIRQLEKKLYIKKKANHIPKSFLNDGLDFILESCDPEKFNLDVEKESVWNTVDKSESSDDDEPETLEIRKIKEKIEKVKKKKEKVDDEIIKTITEKKKTKRKVDEEPIPSITEVKKKKKKVHFSDEVLSEEEYKDENSVSGKDECEDEDGGEDGTMDELKEDIYGRLHDRKGNIVKFEQPVGKYVPPSQRANTKTGNEKQQEIRLKRQMRGFLNRLSESNMHNICSQFEELYRRNSRNAINTAVTSLILDLIGPTLTPENLLIEHALLISVLHANVGSEVGAFFLQTVAEKFNDLFENLDQNSKEIDNIIVLLCQLYNFGVTNCILLFDIMKKVSETINEKELDLILLMLRNVGMTLRKDDSVALKEVVQDIQNKAQNIKEANSRVDFMLEILNSIRNNNVHKIPNYDPTYVEHLKKIRKQFIHPSSYVSELKISLQDLLKARESGRWWIVGSAWTGVLPGEKPSTKTELPNHTKKIKEAEEDLLDNAQKQRMNTDVRRSIFGVIMHSEDYMEAFESLCQLGLNNQQEKEILHILVEISFQEKIYNPYYTRILRKFCGIDKKYQQLLQLCIKEKVSGLNSMVEFQLTNLSSLVLDLIVFNAMQLRILKVISFVDMDKKMLQFVKPVITGILQSEKETCKRVFSSLKDAKYRQLKEGLRVFMKCFVDKSLKAKIAIAMDGMSMGDKQFKL